MTNSIDHIVIKLQMGPNFILLEPLKNIASVLQKIKLNCTKERLHVTYSKPLKTMKPKGLKNKGFMF